MKKICMPMLFLICSLFFLCLFTPPLHAEPSNIKQKTHKKWTALIFTQDGEETIRAMTLEKGGRSTLAIDYLVLASVLLPGIIMAPEDFPETDAKELLGTMQIDKRKPSDISYSVTKLEQYSVFVCYIELFHDDFVEEVQGGKFITFKIDIPNSGSVSYRYSLSGFQEVDELAYAALRKKKEAIYKANAKGDARKEQDKSNDKKD